MKYDKHLTDNNGLFNCAKVGFEFEVRGSTVKAILQNRWQGCRDGVTFITHDADVADMIREGDASQVNYGLRCSYEGNPRRGDKIETSGAIWRCSSTGSVVR